MLWMVLLLFSVDDKPPTGLRTYEYKVGFFELNHCYSDSGQSVLDQIIMWDWVAVNQQSESGKTVKVMRKKVVDWYIVNYRKPLTDDERRQKQRELDADWFKKYGNKYGPAPEYNAPFIGGAKIPRLNSDRDKWMVIIPEDNRLLKIYAAGYIETWSQVDPERENMKEFPIESRRKILHRYGRVDEY